MLLMGSNIWEICSFSDEIVRGSLDESKFAIELHSVLDNTADPVYLNSSIFLSNTYLTENMKGILKSVLLRLARNEGSPVYILDTAFGGGKTHTLLLLYHIFRNKGLGNEYIKRYYIDRETSVLEIPDVHVVAIDCRNIRRKTLWGEIAYLLNSYESVKQYDESREPIQQIEIIKQWFTFTNSSSSSYSLISTHATSDRPVLLLIDELPHYLLEADSISVGNVTLADLTVSFIQKLISAAASMRNCAVIITLTGTQSLYEKYKNILEEEIDEVIDSLKQSVSRQSTTIIPISKKEDIYNVIVKRLVKERNESKLISSKLIDKYVQYYQSRFLVDDPNYRERLLRAYPFHPLLIDILYERVSTIETFNKTRGILRFLATVLHNIYLNRKNIELVSTDSIDLEDQRIRNFLAMLKEDLLQIIDSDCIKHARELDSNKSIKTVESVAKTILLSSLIGSLKESGIRVRDLKLAICKPSMDDSVVDSVLEEIEDRFWYIKKIDSEYLFTTKPNINKIIHDYEGEVKDEEIKEEIDDTLNEIIKSNTENGFAVVKYRDEEDKPELRIVVIDYEEIEDLADNQTDDKEKSVKDLLRRRLEYASERTSNIRSYQNTLVFLYPDINGIEMMKNSARRVIACRKAEKSDIINSDKEYVKAIKAKLSDAISSLNNVIHNTYSKIAYPYHNDIRLASIDTIRYEDPIEAIKHKLRGEGKLLDPEIAVNHYSIQDILENNSEPYMTIEEIYELFMRDRSKPFIIAARSILEGIKEGVRNGSFGYSNELQEVDDKYRAKINEDITPSWEGYIIRKEFIFKDIDNINAMQEIIKNKDKPYMNVEEMHELLSRSKINVSEGIVYNAIKEGVKQGIFGYADNLKEKEGKYEAVINEYVEPKMKGYLIKKEFIQTRKDSVTPSPKHYIFSLNIPTIDDCTKILAKLMLLDLNNRVDKHLKLSLRKSNNEITINNILDSINELKSILQQLKSLGYNGKGELTLKSEDDIGNELKREGLDKYINNG